MTETAAEEKGEQESRTLVEAFMKQLDVDEEVAAILVQEGFSSVEEIAYVPVGELNAIDEFDEDVVNELRNRARDVLLTLAIASEEVIDSAKPAQDLLDVEGMDKATAMQLAAKGACTREDLAELAVDDLMELDEMDEERAGKLIMSARAHWFEDSETAESGS